MDRQQKLIVWALLLMICSAALLVLWHHVVSTPTAMLYDRDMITFEPTSVIVYSTLTPVPELPPLPTAGPTQKKEEPYKPTRTPKQKPTTTFSPHYYRP